MELEIERHLSAISVDPALMFAHTSALADLYQPSIERVFLPEFLSPAKNIKIKVATGYTNEKESGSLKYKIYKKAGKILGAKPALDLEGSFVFDARMDTDKNPAHVLRSATVILLLAESLSKHLGRSVRVVVVLQEKASSLARQIYNTLDIPTVYTDGKVFGDIILNPEQLIYEDVYQLAPSLLNFEFEGYHRDTPERVFIPRRGDRRLINNDEVIALLEKRGFKIIYFEDLTIPEEWSIARNAKVAVAVYGAASYHFIFNRVGLDNIKNDGERFKFINIFSPCYTVTPSTREIAAVVEGQWSAVRGQITPKGLQAIDFSGKQLNSLVSPVKDPFKVDVKSLEMALDHLEVH